MNEIIEILMRRDGISENEARNVLNECIEEIEDAITYGDYDAAEDIVRLYLSLEPDFLEILLNEFV